MTAFAHVTIFDPALDQPTPCDAGLNPDQVLGWMRLAGGGTRVMYAIGRYLDLPTSPEAFEEACRLAGLVPA